MFLYHRFYPTSCIFPKSSKKNNTIKQLLKVPKEFAAELSNKHSKLYHLLRPDAIEMSQKPTKVPLKIFNSYRNPQAAISFSSAALIPN